MSQDAYLLLPLGRIYPSYLSPSLSLVLSVFLSFSLSIYTHTYIRIYVFFLPLRRKAARKGDHDRVAMYLRKYRDGKALKRKVPRITVYNTALRSLDKCKKWRL